MSRKDIASKLGGVCPEAVKYLGFADFDAVGRRPGYAVRIEKALSDYSGGDIFADFFTGQRRSDDEIRSFCGMAAALTLKRLSEGEKAPKYLTLLAKLDETDPDALCLEYSPLERKLSEYPGYRCGDGATRHMYRENCRAYAKKRRTSEDEAASILGESAGKPVCRKTAGALYFIVRFALLAALCFLAASLCGALAALLLIFPLSETSRCVCDFVFSSLLPQKTLPKLKISPATDSQRTICVITELLTGTDSAEDAFRKLESYYLCCRDANVGFGILGDLSDGPDKNAASDEEIVCRAKNAAARLESLYNAHFYLFLRPRVFAETEGRYMGWERKRGAVIALTRLICGKSGEFSTVCGDLGFLSGVKFVITLDADTGLYGDEALRLIKTAAHPCNAPVIHGGIVTDGFAIIQPRIGIDQLSAYRTGFSALISGDPGREIYQRAGYDLWQNLFGEGSFCGKGIFDVRAFSLLIDGAFPDGRILSHDLLEGTRLRAGYAGDIVLYDGVPKNPASYYKRLHRWVRGDVAAAFFGSGVGWLSKYKLWDNLRRILCAVFTPVSVLYSILIPGLPAVVCPLLASSYILLSPLLGLLCRAGNCLPSYGSSVINPLLRPIYYMLWELCSMFHTGAVTLDALVRALWRMLVSKRRLLEWTTAAESDRSGGGFGTYFASMWSSVFAGCMLPLSRSPVCALLGIGWIILPALSCWLSKPKARKKQELSSEQRETVDAYSGKIWKFFADNVDGRTAFLPPDNITARPGEKPKTAMRTSPTDIGLYLTSLVSAYDFALIGRDELETRLRGALSSIGRLEKWNGHLYNWYSLPDLKPTIRFVSSVDSGNLAVCLTSLAAVTELSPELRGSMKKLARQMDFSPLYNPKRGLFSVGFDADKKELAESCYDHYMSECRLASYYAASVRAVPWRHWDSLGRFSKVICGRLGMRSWSGAMFEYFMPELFLPRVRPSLEYQAFCAALKAQMKDSARGVWGRSECCNSSKNEDGDYDYHSRGSVYLGEDENPAVYEQVIAPYAAFLAIPFAAGPALDDLKRLESFGMTGEYGFYEALDLRKPKPEPVYCYMAHHLGMSMTALADARFDGLFVRRFTSDPEMASGSFLTREMLSGDVIRDRSEEREAIGRRNIASVRRNCKQ